MRKRLLSALYIIIVWACSVILLKFLGANLDSRPRWLWVAAGVATLTIWEFMKAGIAKAVVEKMHKPIDIMDG